MPIIDFTGSYRDAARGMTLKALASRRADLEKATMAATRPEQIADPMQGAAHVLGVVGAGLREGRAAAAETAGRERFAQLMSGGLTQDEMGEALTLDPETAMKYQEHTWDTEKAKTERDQAVADMVQKHGWDVEAATAKVQADQDAAKALADRNAQAATVLHERQVQDAKDEEQRQITAKHLEAGLDTDEAKLNESLKFGAMTQAQYDQAMTDLQAKRQSDILKAAPESYRPLTPEEAAKWGGDVQKNPANYKVNAKTGEPELINTNTFSPAEQETRTFKAKSKMTAIDSGLDELNRALEIAPDVTELGEYGRSLYAPSGMVPEGMQPDWYKKTANATKRFDQIMQSNAIKRMAAELSGSDSDKDVQRFISIMADPNSTLTQKRQTVSSMIASLQRERGVTREQLKGLTGEDAGEYSYTNPDVMPGTGGSGGGGGEPVKPADWTDAEWNALTPEEKAQFK